MVSKELNNFAKKYRNEIILISIIILLTGSLALEPEGSNITGDATGPETEKVKIVASELVGFEPMMYSISHRKVPEPKNLNIELETASMTMAELHTRSTSEPIIGILSNVRLAKAQNNDKEFKILAPWYREGMGEDNMTVGQLVTAKNSSIENPKDLEGEKVGLQGLAGGSATAAMTALRAEGVNISKIEFRSVNEETGPLLVNKGELAAAQVDSSVIIQEDFNEKYRTALDFGKVLHREYGAVPPSQFVVVRKDHYEENPEKYDKTVEWLRDNYEWARDNKREVSETRSEMTGGEASGKPVELLMKKFSYFTRIGEITQEDLDVLEAYYKTAEKQGTINKTPDVEKLFKGALEEQ
ncbi:MAG: ABC-type taurine transport system substrate-binding protein [Candidatus Nanohaloarchaea archaeon]|jgi:ABC-type taurine transport system substrate-binding protein